MDSRKPLRTYILVNVAVSAATTLIVLLIWNAATNPAADATSANSFPLASATSGPAPTLGDFEGQLRISSVIGAGDVENERVTIEHIGDADISLAGWRLRDEDRNSYNFPGLVLHPGATVELYSHQGEDSVTELFWNRDDAVWSEGELVSLIDPDGEEQATYTVP